MKGIVRARAILSLILISAGVSAGALVAGCTEEAQSLHGNGAAPDDVGGGAEGARSGARPTSGFAPLGPTVVVATNGNDATGDGSFARPFATIEAALARAKALNPSDVRGGVTIQLREGRYFLRQAVHIQPAHSGITFASYPGENAVIDGGYTFRNGSCGSRWVPQTIATVSGQKSVQVFAFNGACKADLGGALATIRASSNGGGFAASQLFIGGQRRIRSRHPNVGSSAVLDASLITTPLSLLQADAGPPPPRRASVGLVNVDVPNKAALLGQAEAVLELPFEAPRAPITNAYLSGKTLWLDLGLGLAEVIPVGAAVDGFQLRGHLENAQQFLDSPGEWWLDEDKDRLALYYVPQPGEDLTSAELDLPLAEQLFVIDGVDGGARVHDVAFRNLTFEHTAWRYRNGQQQTGTFYYSFGAAGYGLAGAIDGNFLSDVTVDSCQFNGMGEFAVAFGGARTNFATSGNGRARNVVISNNKVYDAGGGGFRVDDRNNDSTNLQIVRNELTSTGAVFVDTPAILVGATSSSLVQGNSVANVPFAGIWVGPACRHNAADSHVVDGNKVYQAMGRLMDGGAIYVSTQNVVIGNNTVSGTHRTSSDASTVSQLHADLGAAKDLYLDDYGSWIKVFHNSLSTVLNKGGTNLFAEPPTFVANAATAEGTCKTSLDGTDGTTPPVWW